MKMEKESSPQPGIKTHTGLAIVVANMIGTGVFTSLGFQVVDLKNFAVILALWVLGGVFALAGTFSYAEIGTVIKRSGGEYTFLSRLFHPMVGFLSGWISLTVGFAAPIALSAIALVEYFPYEGLSLKWTSISILLIITLIHTRNLSLSSSFQNVSTILKVGLIIVFIVLGLVIQGASGNEQVAGGGFFTELMSPPFAIALIFVSYSYSGWNAAAYITEEFRNPRKSLPRAIIGGTFLVTVLYTLLQYVFLKHIPIDDLAGQLDVGTLAAQKMLGENAGDLFGLAISLFLISGISAMVWVGPRVTSAMAADYRLWQFFQPGANGIPVKALWFQFGVSSVLLLTGTFEQILIYCGILLTVSTMLTVCGVFILRTNPKYQKESSYKSPLFPFFQIVFILISLWMIVFAFIQNTMETVLGISNLMIGLGIWYLSEKYESKSPK